MTIRPQEPDQTKKTTYSLTNLHDDTMATTNAQGHLLSTHMTGPFGEALVAPLQTPQAQTSTNTTINTNTPTNTIPGTTWNYLGQHQKLTETDYTLNGGIIQMGARVYIPILGRFLSVDSVEGGTDNNYVYANDPVNEKDLSGKAIPVAIVVAAYIGGIAWAAYDYRKNPTKENAFWLGVSLIPGGGLVNRGPKVLQSGLKYIGNARTIKGVVYNGQKAYNCINTSGCVRKNIVNANRQAIKTYKKLPAPVRSSMKIMTAPKMLNYKKRR